MSRNVESAIVGGTQFSSRTSAYSSGTVIGIPNARRIAGLLPGLLEGVLDTAVDRLTGLKADEVAGAIDARAVRADVPKTDSESMLRGFFALRGVASFSLSPSSFLARFWGLLPAGVKLNRFETSPAISIRLFRGVVDLTGLGEGANTFRFPVVVLVFNVDELRSLVLVADETVGRAKEGVPAIGRVSAGRAGEAKLIWV